MDYVRNAMKEKKNGRTKKMEWYIWLITLGFIYLALQAFMEKNPRMIEKGKETWNKIMEWMNR